MADTQGETPSSAPHTDRHDVAIWRFGAVLSLVTVVAYWLPMIIMELAPSEPVWSLLFAVIGLVPGFAASAVFVGCVAVFEELNGKRRVAPFLTSVAALGAALWIAHIWCVSFFSA